MVTRRREHGYSMMEIVVVLAVFGVFLYIVVSLTAEMRQQEKKYPVNFLANPDINAVMVRLRRDVYDTTAFYAEYANVKASAQVLWVDTITEAGTSEVVMWDFRTPGEAHRRVYNSAQVQVSEWVTHGAPVFAAITSTVDPDNANLQNWPHGVNPVEVTAIDVSDPKNPKLSIDEYLVPRPHP